MYGDEAAAINNALNASDARLGSRSIFIHDANGCRQISVRYIVAAEVLERCIGVNGLIVSIAVDQGSRLIHQCFFEQRDNRLTLGKPLPPRLSNDLRGFRFGERQEARSAGQALPPSQHRQ